MKLLITVLVILIYPLAYAQYIEVGPSYADCLNEAADSLAPYLIEHEKDSRYQLAYDKSNTPVAIFNPQTDRYFSLEGVWQTGPNEEFIQYGDETEVFTALVQYNEDSSECELIHLDNAKKF